MEPRDRRILAKIREEARLASDFICGQEYDDFIANEMTKRAVSMTLANIGELCGALSDDVKSKHHDVPWSAIRRTRNIITHAYDSVDFTIIWDAVVVDIPFLIDKIDTIERELGNELFSEAEMEANYDEIIKAIAKADEDVI